jgi:hypothetical protein
MLRAYIRRARQIGPVSVARRLREPGVLRRHTSWWLRGAAEGASNPYEPSHSETEEIAFCARLCGASDAVAAETYHALDGSAFEARLRAAYSGERRRPFALGRFRIHWTLCRLLRPAVVVETGVHDGLSSAVILQALAANGGGRLVSIDLPSLDLPAGKTPGWLVPEELRKNWTLRLGDARKLLEPALDECGRIDLFFHDSDHSQLHQRFELTSARKHMAAGGVLYSDQDYPGEHVLPQLAADWGAEHYRMRTVSGEPGGFAGAIRLPA